MTKKLLITLSILTLFASCGTRSGNATISDCIDGVVINGVRWATRNVDMPGTFAETPESFGMLFQWNRKKAWSATDERAVGWNDTPDLGTTWYAENDPCPVGWRVPTEQELRSLDEVNSVWTRQNRVRGRLFGTAPNQIFLPAVGANNRYGEFQLSGVWGFYWSSTLYSATTSWSLLSGDNTNLMHFFHAHGLSVRCVAIN